MDNRCPACGDYIEYCSGHGEIGDPVGARVLHNHDMGWHLTCHPLGCENAPKTTNEILLKVWRP